MRKRHTLEMERIDFDVHVMERNVVNQRNVIESDMRRHDHEGDTIMEKTQNIKKKRMCIANLSLSFSSYFRDEKMQMKKSFEIEESLRLENELLVVKNEDDNAKMTKK